MLNLETINVTGDETLETLDFVSVRTIENHGENANSFPLAWYAVDGYDGILLLSQFLWYDTLCYPQEIPILH